ncbi:GNAT family protein [Vibrio sp. CAU 1672]|uniref:GNAT family N-acetyltransferase n=1 Tax=Vibrio sp. CAU 1672 TaxID=3032594 RepID=UPI0023DCD1B1|nr:GNAT family protein [Vibrio sp. CAU 1672]MDF2153932.1 GNAT family protein [Vibrio sp. CAU 1672]
MSLKKHGVVLTPLDASHLEMLRNWRNSEFVRGFMIYQDDISEDAQIKWFSKLKDAQKYYFIISDEDGEYGCCNLNLEVDDEGRLCAEGGVFAAEESRLNSLTPIKAVCTMYEWAFAHQGVNYIKAQIRSDNRRAIRFNAGLGFIVDRVAEGITYATLTHESFNNRYEKIKKILG